ncbi:MAG: hypothetical protein RJA61_288 [Candidatus Parcubacteria bacterium]|jgi:glycosyltransferase involved in cell wall biosynthesis
MKILIATGIYPPSIGGPALYAQELKNTFVRQGHKVIVKTFSFEKKLPSGLRHILFFFKSFYAVLVSDMVIALDTMSVGLPVVILSRLLRKKIVVRIGGDFLWETYVERTKKDVLLKDFYKDTTLFSFKDKFIFFLTHIVLRWSTKIVFNSIWQKDLWVSVYGIEPKKVSVIDNFYGKKISSVAPVKKNFIWATRPLYLKNGNRLKLAFERARQINPDIVLEVGTMPRPILMDCISKCYAVIVPSLTDISPNLIFDALQYNKPFIVTEETGLPQDIKETGVLVDPLDIKDIEEKILFVAEDRNYERLVVQSRSYNKVHDWDAITREFLALFY